MLTPFTWPSETLANSYRYGVRSGHPLGNFQCANPKMVFDALMLHRGAKCVDGTRLSSFR